MYPRLLVLVALLSSSSGLSSASGSETVLAFVGQHVVLPCGYNVGVHDDVPTVEWSKKGLKDLVILYRNGCEDHDMKNPAYLYRTSLITPELKNGNISVRIADVRLSDDGLYYCKRLWETGQPDNTAVRLRVVAVSEPALSVVSPGSGWSLEGGETLQCDATCWLPKPEIHFLDDRGRVIPAETEPKWSREAGECYSVTQRVTLQSPTERFRLFPQFLLLVLLIDPANRTRSLQKFRFTRDYFSLCITPPNRGCLRGKLTVLSTLAQVVFTPQGP